MKKLLKCLILFLIFTTTKVMAMPENTGFNDEKLYSCILYNLNDQIINNVENRDENYVVKDDELLKLTDLTCENFEIKSLGGLEKLSNLTYLDLAGNKNKKIELSKNKKVEYLFVDDYVEVENYDKQVTYMNTGTLKKEPKKISPLVIIGLIIYIIFSIELMLLFIRLGEKAWKALIPVYNFIVLLQKLLLPIFYVILLLIPIINIYVFYKIGISLAEQFNKKKIFAIIFALIPPIGILFLMLGINQEKYETSEVSEFQNYDPNRKIEDGNFGFDENAKVNTIEEVKMSPEPEAEEQPVVQEIDLNPINLEPQTPVLTSDSFKECPNCHSKIKSDAKVCFMCGSSLE